jgi:hypothetical protein
MRPAESDDNPTHLMRPDGWRSHTGAHPLDTLEIFVHDDNHHRGHTAHDGGAPMSLVNDVPAQHS